MVAVEDKLKSLEYRESRGNVWINEKRTVQVQHSSECQRDAFRIIWKEEWKDYHVLILDYSAVEGPVCIVPASVLFKSSFVTEKRVEDSYQNSGYWWSQKLIPLVMAASRLQTCMITSYEFTAKGKEDEHAILQRKTFNPSSLWLNGWEQS